MTTFGTPAPAGSTDFEANREVNLAMLQVLYEKRRAALAGGSAVAKERHLAAERMLPRARVDAVLDPGSPFLEVAELAGDGMHEGVPPGAGIITGIGMISGRACMIIANEATVKGGTYFGITCRKHVRAQTIAQEHRLPCVTLVDSGGAFLPDQEKIFPDEGQFGSILYNQIQMSALGIPQISVVMGACTAGGAYIPALCDEMVIVRGRGFLHIAGPELTEAATGEVVDSETLGGAEMHTSISGVADHLAESDEHALAIVRSIVSTFPEQPPRLRTTVAPEAPLFDAKEIYGFISADAKTPSDTNQIVARLVDGSIIQEFKANYGTTMLCGFARIGGNEVGVLANRGVLFPDAAEKAAHFIHLCCQRDVPLLFLADVTGFMVGRQAEHRGIARAGAKMFTAMASASVPKYTIVVGGSYGAGNLAMAGRAFKPTAMFFWPNGRASIMGPDQAATTLALVQRKIQARDGLPSWTPEEEEGFKAPIRNEYNAFADAYHFASNLWIDGVIDPAETRDLLAKLLDLSSRVPTQETRFGVFRM
jgi:3-methylcrotonyl-CoA carboxylase beta subunit